MNNHTYTRKTIPSHNLFAPYGDEVGGVIDSVVGASPHPILFNPYGVEPQRIKPCKGDIEQRRGLPLRTNDTTTNTKLCKSDIKQRRGLPLRTWQPPPPTPSPDEAT